MLLVALFVVGITYAANIFEGESDQNLIKSGKIAMSYTESSNVINISNAFPMTDNDGKMQTEYFDFSISSKADTDFNDNVGIKIPYNLIIEPKAIDSDKDALTSEQIKVYLTKVEGATETQVLAPTKISALTPVDSNFKLYSIENLHKNGTGMITTEYRLRAWIDYGVDSSNWNQTSKPKQYKFGINVDATGESNLTDTEKLIAKVGTGGLVAESHPATEQLAATTDYRYTGANPNNYIEFNNEEQPWRIIGVFDVDDGTGKLEKRIKIIRNYTSYEAWDYKSDGSYLNDWSKARLMKILNEGDYWNRTGDYKVSGLTDEAKEQIADAMWYLGGTTNGLANHFYGYERGKTAYNSTTPTSWVGKVGLMYPSDYGYATSGGSTTNREACLAKELGTWSYSEAIDCKDNDWLKNNYSNQWTLTPSSDNSNTVFCLTEIGSVSTYNGKLLTVKSNYPFRPTVYLRADIKITGGSGTESDPYYLTPPLPVPSEAVGGAKTLVDKVGTDGIVAESHLRTNQLTATTDYRYTGADPNNYVSFNNEDKPWRIIGVFDVDNGTGKLEKRIKIIRDSIGGVAWDSNKVNDWSKASSMRLLNEGDYWNRKGSYETTGLTDEAKGQIANARWYLGGDSSTLASSCYWYERGKTVYDSTRPISWVGKVGLMYPSDYGYATSGGPTTNRTQCLAKELGNWSNSDVSDCKDNDWLYINSGYQWTLTPLYSQSHTVFSLDERGSVQEYYDGKYLTVNNTYALRPTVYLRSDIQITGGKGTKLEPYTLSK